MGRYRPVVTNSEISVRQLTGNVHDRNLGVLSSSTDQRDVDGAKILGGGSLPGHDERRASGDDLLARGSEDGVEVSSLGKSSGSQCQDGGGDGVGETHLVG